MKRSQRGRSHAASLTSHFRWMRSAMTERKSSGFRCSFNGNNKQCRPSYSNTHTHTHTHTRVPERRGEAKEEEEEEEIINGYLVYRVVVMTTEHRFRWK